MPNPEDNSPLMVFTTLASEADAVSLVRHLVDKRLVACGTVFGGARSVYRWQGAVTDEPEAFVILKSRHGRWDALRTEVEKRHPYEVPELIAVPTTAGLPAYVQWIAAETTPSDREAT